MTRLYRKRHVLPSLALLAAVPLAGCGADPAGEAEQPGLTDQHLELLQDAEATRYQLEQRVQDQRRLDELLERRPPPADR
jgi:hypothetical protein